MRIHHLSLFSWTIVAALAMTAACHSSSEITNGGGSSTGSVAGLPSNVVASASAPADGNATIAATSRLTRNYNGDGFDELDLAQQDTYGAMHWVVVQWDSSTHQLIAVEYWWGDPMAAKAASCDPVNPCDPSKVSIDYANGVVTLSGQVVSTYRGQGTDTSTLTGTIRW